MAKASTNTSNLKSVELDTAFSKISANFRSRIIATYLELKKRHIESDFESAGLNGGKFCESVLRFLQQEVLGSHIAFNKKVPNFSAECLKLENAPQASGAESIRLIIPRALNFIYTVRNKRGIGHLSGDVEANEIDSATITRVADWVICEMIRIYHSLSLEDAQSLVDSLATRQLPLVWSVAGKKRVLKQGLNFSDQVLILTYSELTSGVLVEDLFSWVEHSNFSVFKKQVLDALHKKRLIEYDRETDSVHISPTGIKEVEANLLTKA